MLESPRVIVFLVRVCVSVNLIPPLSHRAAVTSKDLLAFTQQSPEDIYTIKK